MGLVCKDAYISTNELNPSFPSSVVSLSQKIHEKVRANIDRKNGPYARQTNKSRRKVVFEPGDLVWVHLRKERISNQQKTKLQPRGDGSFQVLERYNDNACKIHLLSSLGNVSPSFNVADLSPFDIADSRANPFEQGVMKSMTWTLLKDGSLTFRKI